MYEVRGLDQPTFKAWTHYKGGLACRWLFSLRRRRLDFVDAADMVVVLMPLQITPLRARRHGHY
jgi:hypothetical protein